MYDDRIPRPTAAEDGSRHQKDRGGREPARESNADAASGAETGPSSWVVSKNGSDCAHPKADLHRVGDDGKNTYLQCDGCDAVIVIPDGLVRAARIGR